MSPTLIMLPGLELKRLSRDVAMKVGTDVLWTLIMLPPALAA